MVAPVGALRQWQAELAAGVRTKYHIDPLWKAACREAMADDFAKMGLPNTADDLRREAAEIIVAAAKEKEHTPPGVSSFESAA